MSNNNHLSPDTTVLPGMKTLMGNRQDAFRATYIPDLVYVKRSEQELKLQMLIPGYLPPEVPGIRRKYPLLVYVQGSAWGKQDCYSAIPQLSAMAHRGYVVASVEYRASNIAKFPGFLLDVKSAIRFLRANADTYQIDPERVAVWGDSSGGHAAVMAGATGDFEEFKTEDLREYSDAVSAVIDFYGPTDVTKINDAPRDPIFTANKDNIPEDILFGGCVAEHPELAQPGNPLNYIRENGYFPPILMMHGDSDFMVPFDQSLLLYEKLQECRKTVEFYKVCGAGHGVNFWTEKVIDVVDNFLKAYI